MATLLVTGSAGFIGAAVADALLSRGDTVVGIDDLNPYYDPALKRARLDRLARHEAHTFVQADVADPSAVRDLVATHRPDAVIHLAAQAGVRYSLEHPESYVESNLMGFLRVLEACRHHQVGHLVYASSSSVYGTNTAMPFTTAQPVDHPVSLYAATKKSNELMAHTYSHLFGLPTTGLRFFTVYGPWGRPDMALFKFTRLILSGQPIQVYNHGRMSRDFTYVDDVVDGVIRATGRPATPDPSFSTDAPDPATSSAPFRVYNLGHNAPTPLMDMIATLERKLGIEADKQFLELQPGDVEHTWADSSALMRDTGFAPQTSLDEGIGAFVDWYRDYYGV